MSPRSFQALQVSLALWLSSGLPDDCIGNLFVLSRNARSALLPLQGLSHALLDLGKHLPVQVDGDPISEAELGKVASVTRQNKATGEFVALGHVFVCGTVLLCCLILLNRTRQVKLY